MDVKTSHNILVSCGPSNSVNVITTPDMSTGGQGTQEPPATHGFAEDGKMATELELRLKPRSFEPAYVRDCMKTGFIPSQTCPVVQAALARLKRERRKHHKEKRKSDGESGGSGKQQRRSARY